MLKRVMKLIRLIKTKMPVEVVVFNLPLIIRKSDLPMIVLLFMLFFLLSLVYFHIHKASFHFTFKVMIKKMNNKYQAKSRVSASYASA